MSLYKDWSLAQKITGFRIRIGLEESIHSVWIHPDKIYVVMNRARVSESYNRYTVTDRGVTTFLFTRDGAGVWSRQQLTAWGMAATPERHAVRPGPDPATYQASLEWADLCHRPGTYLSPLDNEDRKAQGY